MMPFFMNDLLSSIFKCHGEVYCFCPGFVRKSSNFCSKEQSSKMVVKCSVCLCLKSTQYFKFEVMEKYFSDHQKLAEKIRLERCVSFLNSTPRGIRLYHDL